LEFDRRRGRGASPRSCGAAGPQTPAQAVPVVNQTPEASQSRFAQSKLGLQDVPFRSDLIVTSRPAGVAVVGPRLQSYGGRLDRAGAGVGDRSDLVAQALPGVEPDGSPLGACQGLSCFRRKWRNATSEL